MNRSVLNKALLIALLFLGKLSTAQVDYIRSSFNGTYVPISGGTPVTIANNSIVNVPLPFNFEWNGSPYTTSNFLAISTNGYVSFLTSNTATTISAIPYNLYTTSNLNPNTAIAPWFGNNLVVNASGGNGQIITSVTAPQEWTIQWTNVWAYSSSTSIANPTTSLTTHRQINFQVKFYGSAHSTKANQIEFHYGAIAGTKNASEYAAVGIKGKHQTPGSALDAISGSKKVGNAMLSTSQWPKEFFRFIPSTAAPTPIATGTYTVGSGKDYSSISAALADLHVKGISGPVTLELTDAVYDSTTNYFPLLLGPVTGASSSNRITIKGTHPSGTIIRSPGCGSGGNIANAATASALSGSQEPVLGLVGASYVTVKDLKFEAANNNTLLDRGIAITNSTGTLGAYEDSLINITVNLNRANTSSVGISQEVGTTVSATSGAALNNKFFNINVFNCYSGMLLSGTASFADMGTDVGTFSTTAYNLFDSIGGGSSATHGIQAVNQTDCRIFNNEIRNITDNSSNTVNGIWINETTSGTTERKYHIFNNKIHDLSKITYTGTTGGVYGIRAALTNNAASFARIYNNFITGLHSTATNATSRGVFGIYLSGSATVNHNYMFAVDFNTVIIDETNCSNTCFEISAGTAAIDKPFNVRNNIFANYTGAQAGTIKHYCWSSSSASSIGTGISNRNVLYIDNASNGFVGRGNTTDFLSLSNWKTIAANVDVNSRSENPQLISTNDYKISTTVPTPVESSASLSGITWVTKDIDGNNRNASTPDIGAYEGNFIAFSDNDVSPAAFINPTAEDVFLPSGTGFKPVLRVKNNGVSAQSNFTVRYRVTGPLPATAEVYNKTKQISSLGSGATVLDTFDVFIPATGVYQLEAITELASDENFANDTLRTVFAVSGALNGTINIGRASQHPYGTLTNAIKALNLCGVSAPVTFLLNDARYDTLETFPLDIKKPAGISAVNTFRIKPAPGVNAVIEGSSPNFMIRLSDASYITIDGSNTNGGTSRNLGIINNSVFASTGVIWLSSSATNPAVGCTFDTIKNSYLKAGAPDITTTFGIYVSGTTISTTGTGVNNDNIVIQNNKIEKAHRGIYARAATSGYSDNFVIAGNEIGSDSAGSYIWLKGIEVAAHNNLEIRSNRIYNLVPSTAITPIGIDYISNIRKSRIHKNVIDNIGSTSSSATGAYGISFTAGTIDTALIQNNFITDVAMATGSSSATNVATGIRITSGNVIHINNNSIRLNGNINGGSPNSSALLITSSAVTSLYVNNNIFINTTTGNTKRYAIYAAGGTEFGNINNNAYYTGATGLSNYLGKDLTTLNQWRAETSNELASLVYNPAFISGKNLRFNNGATSALESAGAPISFVTDDIDGNLRSATPDIGAYEFNGIAQDISGPAINYTKLAKTGILTNRQFIAQIVDGSLVDSNSIQKPRVYFKKSTDANTFTGNTSFDNGWKFKEALNNTSPFQFELDYSLLTGGNINSGDIIQYFVVAQDLAAIPNVGINGGEFLSIPASVDLLPADFPLTPLDSFIIVTTIPDTVYVGTNHTITSLTNAGGLFDEINKRIIKGNVLALITSDLSETGLIALNEYAEDGAGNYTLTIRPDTSVSRTISGSVNLKGLINLNGTDRFVLDGRYKGAGNYLTIVNNSSTTKTCVIQLMNQGSNLNITFPGCEDVTIRNTNIVGGSMHTSNSYNDAVMGIYCGNSITAPGAAFNNKVFIIGNRFARMGSGIYFNGYSTAFNQLHVDSNIFGTNKDDSTIFMMAGLITTIGPDMLKIRGNVLQNFVQNNSTYSSTMTGFQISGSPTLRGEISGNTFRGFRNYKTSNNIYALDIQSGTGDSLMIINNLVYDFESNNTGANSVIGFNIGNTNNVPVLYNTINFYPNKLTSSPGSSCIVTTQSGAKANIRNNNLVNKLPGAAFGLYLSGVASVQSDYNNIYVPSGNIGRVGSTNHANLTSWKTTFLDANSLSDNPFFNSDSNLVLMPSSTLKGKGQLIPGLNTDITGALRGNPPSIGAYENAIDKTAPLISYTRLRSSLIDNQRIVPDISITDINGKVNVTAGSAPRVYYKKTSDANEYNDNTFFTQGWKYAEALNNSSPFSFTIDYNLLWGGGSVSNADTIQYFFIAQDTAIVPNVTVNRGTLTMPASSVALTAANFPVKDSINYYSMTSPLSGNYFVGSGNQFTSFTDNGGFFEAVNNTSLASSINVYVTSDVTETGIHALNNVAETGTGGYTINVYTYGQYNVSGASNNPLIRLNDVKNLVIDGEFSGSRGLTFRNTASGGVFEFMNSSKDTLRNMIIKGNTTNADSALVAIRNGSNSLLFINNLFIKDTLAPRNAIFSRSTTSLTNSNIRITGNEFAGMAGSGIQVAALGNGSNWSIVNNHFYNTTPAKSSQVAINFVAGALSENDSISGNHIGGQQAFTGGAPLINEGAVGATTFKGISVAAGSEQSPVYIGNNRIRNIRLTSTVVPMSFTGIEYTGTAKTTITGNIIGDSLGSTDSITIYGSTGTTVNMGISSSSGSESIITGNKIQGISSYGTANNNLTGINVTGNGKAQIVQNRIFNLFSAGSDVNQISARPLAGIFIGAGSKTHNIRKNEISDLVGSGGGLPSGNASTIVRAIMVNSSNSGGYISQNKLYNIQNRSTGTGEIHGIYYFTGAGGGAVWTIDNNVIHLTNGTNTNNVKIEGIHDRNADPGRNIMLINNTIYIGGYALSGNLGSACYERIVASANLLENNIFYNERTGGTGKHSTISNKNVPGAWSSTTSNYNLFVSTDTASIIEWGTAGATISPDSFKTATSSDRFSYFANIIDLPSSTLFNNVSDGDLSVNANNQNSWAVNGKGKAIDSIALSIEDIQRSTSLGLPVDIGAYEFTPLVAPALAYAYTNGTTTDIVYLTRKLASINYTAGSAPGAVEWQYFSGVTPVTSVAGKKINSYTHMNGSGGAGYTFDINYAYSPAEISDVQQANLKLVKTTDNGATYALFNSSVVNTAQSVVSATGLTSFGNFTLTDMSNPLPVKLTAFTAVRKGENVMVNWSTVSEINASHFVIEASADGKNFIGVQEVKANGTSSVQSVYSFIHRQAQKAMNGATVIYYRLNMVDNNNSSTKSGVVMVSFDREEKLLDKTSAYPNPFNNEITLSIPSFSAEKASISVFDIQGRNILTQEKQLHEGINHLVIDELDSIEQGVYFIRVNMNNESKTIKIVKQ